MKNLFILLATVFLSSQAHAQSQDYKKVLEAVANAKVTAVYASTLADVWTLRANTTTAMVERKFKKACFRAGQTYEKSNQLRLIAINAKRDTKEADDHMNANLDYLERFCNN